jgi:hypothetical protein
MEEIKEEEEEIKEFINGCHDDYKEVEYLIGFVDSDTKEPDDEEDKLIYNINKILFTPNPNPKDNNERLKQIIKLKKLYNVRQIARNIFVLLHYHDLMENNDKPSWGESLLRDLIGKDEINKEIFIKEYEYVYNKEFVQSAIDPNEIELNIESVPKLMRSVPKLMRSVPTLMRSVPTRIPRNAGGGKMYKNDRNNNKK